MTVQCLVSSIDGVTNGGKISKEWVALILLPIINLASESYDRGKSIEDAREDKLSVSIGLVVGASIVSELNFCTRKYQH